MVVIVVVGVIVVVVVVVVVVVSWPMWPVVFYGYLDDCDNVGFSVRGILHLGVLATGS